MALTAAIAGPLKCTTAHAQDAEPEPAPRLPIAYVDRPLTTPRLVLAGSLGLSLAEARTLGNSTVTVQTPTGPVVGVGQQVVVTTDTWLLSPGASMGITDDVELHTRPLPMMLASSNLQLGAPSVGVTYRFVRARVLEMGVGGDLVVYAERASGVGQTLALPLLLHLGHVARIDTGPTLTLSSRDTTVATLSVPARLTFQLVEGVFVGATSGMRMLLAAFGNDTTLLPTLSESLTIPLGFFAGVTIPGRQGPVFDVRPFFTWSSFATPNLPTSTHTDTFHTGLVATGFLYL